VLKFGDRTQIGATQLATSLVADLGLVTAAIVWGVGTHGTGQEITPVVMAAVVSFATGALFANVTSVVLLVAETVTMRR
jgi:hypothetical protein